MSTDCPSCRTHNRSNARYCKQCGTPILTDGMKSLTELVGMESAKKQLRLLLDTVKAMRSRNGKTHIALNMHMIVMGNTGTGKSLFINVLHDTYRANGIVTKTGPTVIDAANFDEFAGNLVENIEKAKNGILCIDNLQKLVQEDSADNVTLLDKLLSRMNTFGNNPIVVFTGMPRGMDAFLAKDPATLNRFGYVFRFADLTAEELHTLCVRKLGSYDLPLTDEAGKRLLAFFKHAVRTKTPAFGNGHFALQTAETVVKAYYQRTSGVHGDSQAILPEDIQGEIPEEKTLEKILSELDGFIGMANVKAAVREIASQIQAEQERSKRGLGNSEKPALHIVLTGNPGTGKTTVARKLGEVLAAIGFLDRGHVVEVDRSKLVAGFEGQTPGKVNACVDEAMGGILFVDEAYTLAPDDESHSGDPFGKEAVETLMKRMEDDRGKFTVIAAGYIGEMERLYRVNDGVRSRFDKFIHIEDYAPDELEAIYKSFLSKRDYKLAPDAEGLVHKAIGEIYERREKAFANGREMRKLFDATMARQAERIRKLTADEQSDDTLITITCADIPYEAPKETTMDDVMRELDDYVGMQAIKNEVRNLVNFLRVEKERTQRGGKKTPITLHFVFTGNPGTGKTSIARIIGRVLTLLGFLAKGHVVETDRSKLVAGVVGETALKTSRVIENAMGGVLFVDEAYSLIPQNATSDFGPEAVDTILKRMEDDRGRFVVIVAGYPDNMKRFLESNPGLPSRFPKHIHFEDYTADELAAIFRGFVRQKGMTLSPEAEATLCAISNELYDQRDATFGNARTMRTIFEHALELQGTRLAKADMQSCSDEQLREIIAEDIHS